MSMIDPTDDTMKSVRLRLRLSNLGTAVPGRFRTADVYLFNTQQELARKFKEKCMIGKTTLDGEPILYIGAIAREGVLAELVDDKFGEHRRKIFERIYIDEFELSRKVVSLEAWARQFNVPIHAPETIIAQEERDREKRKRQFQEDRAARLARVAVGTMGAAERRKREKQTFLNSIHYYNIDFKLETSGGTQFDVRIRKQGNELARARHLGVMITTPYTQPGKAFVKRVKPGSYFDEALQRTDHAGDGPPFEVINLYIDGHRYAPPAHGGRSDADDMLAALRGVFNREWGPHLYPDALEKRRFADARATMGTYGRMAAGTDGPYFDMAVTPMGRLSMGTKGRGTCGTGAIAGQASKGLAWVKAKGRGAKSAIGDAYWKSVTDKVGDNLKSQHSNFLEEHKSHAKQWAADLENLTKDLKAALTALQKAEGLDNEDPKKDKKVKAAEDKRDKVLAKMDRWLESHDDAPREKIAQMYEPFRLGGVDAAKKLEKLDGAVHKAIHDLEGKYTPLTYKAADEAKKILTDAIKAAVALGWEATSLSNRKAYGL